MRVMTDSWVIAAIIRSEPHRQKGQVAISSANTRPRSLAQLQEGVPVCASSPRPPPVGAVLDEPIRRHLEHGRILVENSPRRTPDTSSTRIFVEKLIHRKVIDHCGKLCHC